MAVLCLGCGGLIHGQNGTVSSPQWPAEYPPNTECLWEIIVPAGYHIIAQFNDSFFGLQADCQDYVEVSETGMANRLCGHMKPLLNILALYVVFFLF